MSQSRAAWSRLPRRGVVLVAMVAVVAGCDVGDAGMPAPPTGTTSVSPAPADSTTPNPTSSPVPTPTEPSSPSTSPTSDSPPSPDAGGPTTAAVPGPDGLTADPRPDGSPGALSDVAAAAGSSHRELLALATALDPLALGVVTSRPAARLALEAAEAGPIVVGDVVLERDGDQRVVLAVDMALVMPSAPRRIVLRTLAVTDAVRTADEVTLTATMDGQSVDVALEPGMDRAVVDLATARPDGVALRIQMRTVVPTNGDDLIPGRSPGSYGLFSDQSDVVALGHWLPVPVAIPGNDGDVPAWGDLGAFAPALWFLDVTVPDGVVQTGAVDFRAVDVDGRAVAGRQVAIGYGQRDVAAVWEPGGDESRSPSRRTERPLGQVSAWSNGGDDEAVAAMSARQLAWLGQLLGPLPWPEHDVVRIDMSAAAGMEYPGMVLVGMDFWDPTRLPGEYVLIHEWAHQYFHALVGNGSLSDPVVDEPLAQYLSWRWFLDQGGPEAARQARLAFADDDGLPSADAPGLPADEFTSAATYGTAIYATAATGWIRAAQDHGVAVVDEVVVALVDQFSLGRGVTEEDVIDTARSIDPGVADDLADVFDGPG